MNFKIKYKIHLKQIIFGVLLVLFGSVQAQENLIPTPISLKYTKDSLNLSKGIHIQIDEKKYPFEVETAKNIMKSFGVVLKNKGTEFPQLIFEKVPVQKIRVDAYLLSINKKEIKITASHSAGLFYALQTLRQMDVKNHKLATLEIRDQPAFGWRGFLIDVGRNYQPLALIKQQLEVMAAYKLNIFHFHFTEDIAWRLTSKKYPGLTAAANMTRWKGDFYTEGDMKELIQFCKDRHITLIPEIDMPGHSAAFQRFFGVDMQSEKGMFYIKDLLKEFRTTYPELTTLHIGGDEVDISNKNFMPEITKYVESLGFSTTIGWDPGSNLQPETLRQLWMGGPESVDSDNPFIAIDSKHLYLNHMDPLETVTTLFFRKFGMKDRENPKLKGATLCSWSDRAVAKSEDQLLQNAIYPGILTFAERIWNGGGKDQWVCNLPPLGTKDNQEFHLFEQRLLKHKKRYFQNLHFPYVRQSGEIWELVGPFENQGNVSISFDIEKNPWADSIKVNKKVEGGTVILRHWWANILKGAIEQPEENTTWYARTKIWSDEDKMGYFWIDFNNLSRSYATDTPQLGSWDDKGSKVWVNNLEVHPPNWQNADKKGDLESPLVDEGYSYRPSTKIPLKKGWNHVFLKLPVTSFKGKDWQNPVKWMFTFVETDH